MTTMSVVGAAESTNRSVFGFKSRYKDFFIQHSIYTIGITLDVNKSYIQEEGSSTKEREVGHKPE